MVAGIAARDRSRAEAFASKHGVPTVYRNYEELVEAPELDAVYIPLPNHLHTSWTLAALAADKHVLCEKPASANADEAEGVLVAAAHQRRVVMEAFHWRYHPLADRMLELIKGGELGQVRHIEAALIFPLPHRSDIRWQFDLAGGSLMDSGCYPVHMVRTLAEAEPVVVAAAAKLRSPQVDRWIRADLRFEDGRTGRITAGLWSFPIVRMVVRVTGEHAVMTVLNPLAPQVFNRLTITGKDLVRREHIRARPTYEYQMDAFVSAIREGASSRPAPQTAWPT